MGPEPDATTPTASAMRRALARARDGKTLDVTEAAVLLHARGDDLTTLSEYASRIRDAGLAEAGRAGIITYSRKVFIPLTRLCRDPPVEREGRPALRVTRQGPGGAAPRARRRRTQLGPVHHRCPHRHR